MRMRHGQAAVLLLLLAGCEATAPPSPYQLHSGAAPLDARRPASARRDDTPPAVPVPVEWSFATAASECVASTSGPPRTPVFTARVDRAVHFAASPGGGASRITFSGPGGSWTMRAARSGHDATATLPLNGAAVARLLTLLAGGRLRFEGGAHPATLLLPDAGVSGRDWIGCANARAREARSVAGR